MHNIWVRLNAVIFFGLTVLLALAGMCAFRKHGLKLDFPPELIGSTGLVILYCALSSIDHLSRFITCFCSFDALRLSSDLPHEMAIVFSTYFHTDMPIVKTLQVNNLKSLRNHGGADRALLSFDLIADLRPAFHWNLKQLFVFVVAEYESSTNPLNQIIIWDKIITSKESANLKIRDEFVKYALIDQGSELRNKTVELKLMWDAMPLTGRMYVQSKGDFNYTLPGKYVNK